MITTDDILNMNFYKKEKFTGSYKGMHYLVKKEKDDAAKMAIFSALLYGLVRIILQQLPSTKKNFPQRFLSPKREKQQVVDWLNEQWASRKQWGIIMHS